MIEIRRSLPLGTSLGRSVAGPPAAFMCRGVMEPKVHVVGGLPSADGNRDFMGGFG